MLRLYQVICQVAETVGITFYQQSCTDCWHPAFSIKMQHAEGALHLSTKLASLYCRAQF